MVNYITLRPIILNGYNDLASITLIKSKVMENIESYMNAKQMGFPNIG